MAHNQYQSNPYNQGPTTEQGYGYGYEGQQGGYGQQQQGYGGQQGYGQQQNQGPEQHEMTSYDQQQQGGASVMNQGDFLSRVQTIRNEIKGLTADVAQIESLHQRALGGADNTAQQQLEHLVSQTQLRNTGIRDAIRNLKGDVERTRDGSAGMKKRQFDTLQGDFRKELEKYMQKEAEYKNRYREQIARQYRIVNPDAPEEEVRQAADADWGNEGIFQQALRTNRTGQASAVLGAVRARHNELQRIEQSIQELALLFQDLDTMVVVQDVGITRAEEQTEQVTQHLDQGNKQVAIASDHARRRRKLKWWCLVVSILIIIAIALGVGLGVWSANRATGGGQ